MNRPSDFEVRAATPADLAACAGIHEACQREILPGRAEARARDGFDSATAGEEVFIAATGDGSVAGFLSLWRADAFVHFLHVRPGWRRRGIGRALLERALATVPGPAELKCAPHNRGALAFYARLGWAEVAREPDGPEPFVRLRLARRAAGEGADQSRR
jgi:ribosomal protein S18 acetylase RimI-like enzyme